MGSQSNYKKVITPPIASDATPQTANTENSRPQQEPAGTKPRDTPMKPQYWDFPKPH